MPQRVKEESSHEDEFVSAPEGCFQMHVKNMAFHALNEHKQQTYCK